MLVITRKNGEQLIIGHDIEVTVLKIRGNRVKLGIRGPTAEEQGEEDRSSPSFGNRSGPSSGVATMPRKRLVHDGEAADRQLERRIKNFLEGLNLPALRDLEVEVRNGTAIITGRVRTFHQKQLATSCCQRVAGVLSVANEVRVTDSPGASARREDGS